MTTNKVILGNNLDILPTIPDNSIDSIVTDPPYELGFMGKAWDATGIAYSVELWRECLRVLKPGGHLLAFGGSRTYHRLACAVEDAGFEIRDQIMWVYGSGFPKSLDVSKAIDKAAGVKFSSEPASGVGFMTPNGNGGYNVTKNKQTRAGDMTEDARRWQGWGTALKPAHEPIVLARKPLSGTVASNVLEYGTGAINIDGCRVDMGDEYDPTKIQRQQNSSGSIEGAFGASSLIGKEIATYKPGGRWPANFIHDGSDKVVQQFPRSKGGVYPAARGQAVNTSFASGQPTEGGMRTMGDDGSAARFFANLTFSEDDATSFIYCAKSNTKERNAGLDGLDPKRDSDLTADNLPGGDNPRNRTNTARRNHHPTVKPIALMRYLCRLVTPPNGTVLDPFAGSGTTLVAATLEGFHSTGIELTADYIPIIEGRIQWAKEHVENRQPMLEL